MRVVSTSYWVDLKWSNDQGKQKLIEWHTMIANFLKCHDPSFHFRMSNVRWWTLYNFVSFKGCIVHIHVWNNGKENEYYNWLWRWCELNCWYLLMMMYVIVWYCCTKKSTEKYSIFTLHTCFVSFWYLFTAKCDVTLATLDIKELPMSN